MNLSIYQTVTKLWQSINILNSTTLVKFFTPLSTLLEGVDTKKA